MVQIVLGASECFASMYIHPLLTICFYSPKPHLPAPKEYDPPSPPSQRDLGPPPPGYGRYADFDRGFSGGPGGGSSGPGAQQGPRRNLDDVLCFKCGEKGHYANHCQLPTYLGRMHCRASDHVYTDF